MACGITARIGCRICFEEMSEKQQFRMITFAGFFCFVHDECFRRSSEKFIFVKKAADGKDQTCLKVFYEKLFPLGKRLQIAVKDEDVDLVRFLLDKGEIDSKELAIILQEASLRGQKEMVRILLTSKKIRKQEIRLAKSLAELMGFEDLAILLRSHF